jgi:eukaryotic-like serine/threonine-protein kinase
MGATATTFTAEEWKLLSPYLDEALDMTAPDRSIWLASLRIQEPAIAGQLDLLLSAHSAMAKDGFLEKLSIELPNAATMAGQTLGVYKLKSLIGQGGMSTVWLAERIDGRFERSVAVKFLNVSLIGTDGEERFKREGKILGLLVHPHIAELLDAGVTATGQPYLVLNYIEGDHIDLYCNRHELNTLERVRLFLDVLEAVAHAHANLIVHRDLKPSNVLVRQDGQLKLLDFGISKLLEGERQAADAIQFTALGVQAMTPLYAAPEQLKGEAVTTATDVYALGVLLYVLLTGQHPSGSAPNTPADVIKAIVDTEPLRPSDLVVSSRTAQELINASAHSRATTPEKLRRQLRGDLDTILAKALKKDPNDRYGSVTAFAEDLRRYLRSEPIGARADNLRYRAVKFVRRNRTVVALASIAIMAAVAGAVGISIQAHTANTQRDLAIQQLVRAERIADLNQLLMTDAAPKGKPVTVNNLMDLEESVVKREHYNDAANHIEMLASVGNQYSSIDQNAKAIGILEEALRLSQTLKDRSMHAKMSCSLTGALVPVGDLTRAESLFQQGLQELPDEPQFARDRAECLLLGAEVAYHQGQAKESVRRGEAAEQMLSRSTVPYPLEELHIANDIAGIYGANGQYLEADAEFKRASALMASLGYDETQRAVKLYNDWALTLTYAGRQLEAEKVYRRAIDINRTNQTEETVLPVLLHNYAGVLRELGRLQESAHYAELAYAEAQSAGDQILMFQINLQMARIYRDQRDFKRANAIFAELEPGLRRKLPPGHFAFATLSYDKARLEQAEGNLPEALRLAQQAIAIDEQAIHSGGQGIIHLPMFYVRKSNIELDLHQTDQAVADASRALSLLQTSMQSGSLSSNKGFASLALGRALQAQGKRDEARAAFRTAEENLQPTLGASHVDTRLAHQLAAS